MSRFTPVPVGAALERYAVSEVQSTNDGVRARVHVALWEGNYSKGHQSNYTPVPTRWLVIEARDADSDALLRYAGTRDPRRACQSFSGKRYATALRQFEQIVRRDRFSEPGPGDARRYYHQVHGNRRAA